MDTAFLMRKYRSSGISGARPDGARAATASASADENNVTVPNNLEAAERAL